MTIERRLAVIDAKGLARARASQVLAVDETIIGRSFALPDAAAPIARVDGAGKEVPAEQAKEGSAVAIVRVSGPLAQKAFADLCGYVDGYDAISARFTRAVADPAVGAVVLVFDSPGGDVAGLEEAVARMTRARDEAKKPVFAFVDELAASAAYWLASSLANAGVYAPGAALIGSIGCIGALVDETKALEQEGLVITLIRDPDGKADGHPAGPVSELATERTTELVKSAANRFYAAVGAARRMTVATVRGLNAAVFEAPKALANGLIDGVESREDVLRRAAAAIEQRRSESMSTALLAALGAKDEGEALSRIQGLQAVTKAAHEATGEQDPERISGALKALKVTSESGIAIAAQMGADGYAISFDDAGKVSIVDTKREAEEKTRLIAQLRSEKKLTATQEAWAKTQSLASLQGFAGGAQAYGGPAVADADPQVSASPELLKTLKALGLTEEDHRAAKSAGI